MPERLLTAPSKKKIWTWTCECTADRYLVGVARLQYCGPWKSVC
jgi:hypothetical protein